MLSATSEYALRALTRLAQLPRGDAILGRDLAMRAAADTHTLVDPHLDDRLHEAAGGPLVPQLPAAAAPVVGLARLDGPREGLAVHHPHHQHLAGGVVGGHAGDEAVGVELRCELGTFLDLLDAGSCGEFTGHGNGPCLDWAKL